MECQGGRAATIACPRLALAQPTHTKTEIQAELLRLLICVYLYFLPGRVSNANLLVCSRGHHCDQDYLRLQLVLLTQKLSPQAQIAISPIYLLILRRLNIHMLRANLGLHNLVSEEFLTSAFMCHPVPCMRLCLSCNRLINTLSPTQEDQVLPLFMHIVTLPTTITIRGDHGQIQRRTQYQSKF